MRHYAAYRKVLTSYRPWHPGGATFGLGPLSAVRLEPNGAPHKVAAFRLRASAGLASGSACGWVGMVRFRGICDRVQEQARHAARSQGPVFDAHGHRVAAAQLAVDCEVEHRQVSNLLVVLQVDSDCPDILWLPWQLLPDQLALVPGFPSVSGLHVSSPAGPTVCRSQLDGYYD